MPQNPARFEQKPCTLPRRLLVMIYDGVILLGILMLASAVALPFGEADKIAFRDLWFTVWLFAACFAYLGVCWRYGGMTVGMRAWKVRLISMDGKTINWPRCLLRYLVGIASLAALGLGILWAVADQRRRCWHDFAARTMLVKV